MKSVETKNITIIGIRGEANSGKSTVAEHFSKMGYVEISFADPIKRGLMGAFDVSRGYLWGPSAGRNKIIPSTGKTIREALQTFGEAMRQSNPDVWVNIAEANALEVLTTFRDYVEYSGVLSFGSTEYFNGVVFSDVRHVNEAEMVKNFASKNAPYFPINVGLKSLLVSTKRKGSGATGEFAKHVSETEMKKIPEEWFAHTFDNDAPLGNLEEQVKDFLRLKGLPTRPPAK